LKRLVSSFCADISTVIGFVTLADINCKGREIDREFRGWRSSEMGSFINVAFQNGCFTTASHPLSLSLPAMMILFLTTISATILMSMPGSCNADVQNGDDKIGNEFPAEIEALMSSMSSFAVGDGYNYLEGNNSLKFVEAWALGNPQKVLDHHGGFREVFNVMGEGAVGDGRVDDAKVSYNEV
jgi:hypothetical protein